MLHNKGGCYHSRMTLHYLRLWLGKERAFHDGFEEANKPAVKCHGEGQVSGSHSAPRPEGSQWEAKGLCHQTTRRKIWPTTWKNMKMDSPLMGPWVRAQTSWHLRHSPLTLVWTSDLQNSERIRLCCFQSQVYGNLLRQQREIHIATQSFNSIPVLLESTPSWSRNPL